MNIRLVTDRPGHPVLARTAAELATRSRVRILDSSDLPSFEVEVRAELSQIADVYLLRSHVPAVVALVSTLEAAGALVINPCGATAVCADRAELTSRAEAAGLPWPRTLSLGDLRTTLADPDGLSQLSYPLVVKSRLSRRDDLVRRVASIGQLVELAVAWQGEPVIVQEYLDNDEVDRKLYVVDDRVFGVSGTSPLSADTPRAREEIAIPPAWRDLVLEVGRLLGLSVYGVDIILAPGGPTIVDVNAFPGFRGVPGACEALVAMVERLAPGKVTTA